jgi:cytochrome bd ubiquinol oxidase subunit II
MAVADTTVLLAVVLGGSLTVYALLGGADYGGGVWDLLATGPAAERQRRTIARAIGPVWEANHVWLIVAVVVLFAGFPRAFAHVSTFLHLPLLGVLLGIVLRGSAFVFRAYGARDARQERAWGRVFSSASIATPLFLGVVIGALTEGRLPAEATGSFTAIYLRPWLTPFAISVGLFALVLFAFLAAVYLTLEAADDADREAFRRRALASGVAVAVMAALVLALVGDEVRARLLFSAWALPLHIAAACAAVAAFAALWRRWFHTARIAAAAQVTLILWGWMLAQYPFAVRPWLTMADAAAPAAVRVMLLQVLGVGALVLLPALVYLFRVCGPREGPPRVDHSSRVASSETAAPAAAAGGGDERR